MLSILNRGGNVVTRTAYNPFVKRDLNYGFSHGRTRDTYHPYWTNNFSSRFDLKKRVVEQPQLPTFKQIRCWGSWTKNVKQNEFNNNQLNWWIILGIISGAIGLWSFTEIKAEGAEDGDEKHVKLNEKNYEAIIARLRNNDPNLLSIELKIPLKEPKLRLLCEAIKDNTTIGYIAWHEKQIKVGYVKSINKRLEENNKNFRFFPNDHVYSLLSNHAYITAIVGDKVSLKGRHKGRETYIQDWVVHSTDDDTKGSGYYAVACRNDKTKQIVLAFRGTEFSKEDFIKGDSDIKTVIEGVLNCKIVEQQRRAYYSTRKIVEWAKQNGYSFSVTGHSLGGWLAELSAYYCYRSFSHSDVRAVTFDSPGSLPMFEKLGYNIKNHETTLDLDDIDIITYLSEPNYMNSCNKHVGRVYRVFSDVSSDDEGWLYKYGSEIPFIKDKIAPIKTLAVDSLFLLIDSFDTATGKPKNYSQILNWPHVEYSRGNSSVADVIREISRRVIEGFPQLPPAITDPIVNTIFDPIIKYISSYTAVNMVDVLADVIIKGNLAAEQYDEYLKHAGCEGSYKVRKSLIDKEEFDLIYVGHYEEKPVNDSIDIVKIDEGEIGWYLHELKAREENLKKSTLPEGLKKLVDCYEIYRGEKNKYYIRLINNDIDTDILKQRMRRLIEVIPKSRELLKGFFIKSNQRSIQGKREGVEKSVKRMLDNIPSVKDLNFVGRKGDMEKLKEELENRNIVIISGVAGIGKTSLVKEYAYEFLKERGELVRWIEAKSSTIANEYANLANALKIPHKGESIEELRDLIYGELNMIEDSVYLVLNNVDNEGELKRFLKNKPENVKVLITTRNEMLLQEEGYEPIKLPGLLESDAIDYITQSLNASDEEAKELIHAIECDKYKGVRPMSLHLAVSYLREQHLKSIKEYLKERSNRKDSENNPDINIAIGSLSFSAKKVLKYCAYLDADNISIEILNNMMKHSQEKLIRSLGYLDIDNIAVDMLTSMIKDDYELSRGIKELRATGLVSLKDRESLSIHKEVQNTVKDKDKDANLVKELFDEINELFPDCCVYEYDENKIEKAKKLVRSAVSVAETASELSILDNERMWLLSRKLGTYYGNVIVDLEKSLVYHQVALYIAEQLYSNNRPTSMIFRPQDKDIGLVYKKLSEAKSESERHEALQMLMTLVVLGNYLAVVESLNDVGVTYKQLGETKKALEYLEKALQMVPAELDEPKKAFEYQEKTLQMVQPFLGSRLLVARSLGNLGGVYMELNKPIEGLEYEEKALEMYRTLYSEDHPYVVSCLNSIGEAYKMLGKPKEALEYQDKALQMNQARYSVNHPELAVSLGTSGSTYLMLGDLEKALEHEEKALQMLQVVHIGNHPYIARSLSLLAEINMRLGKLEKSLEYQEKALEMYSTLYSVNHPDVADSLDNIGEIYEQLGKLERGFEYRKKAMEVYNALYIEDRIDTNTYLNKRGNFIDLVKGAIK